MIPIASGITYLFFRRQRYNFWEHALINTYIAAQLNIMQLINHLIVFFVVLLTGRFGSIDIATTIPFFMSAFLFLYGTVFGYLMSGRFSIFWLSVRLFLMNTVLFFVYFIGFQLAGIMQPW